jgi:hydroxyacylglutathione hydrolase
MKLTDNLYLYPEKGILDCNTYVIKDELIVVIDPGLTKFLPALIDDLGTDGINPENIDIITNTHLHPDHCWANRFLKESSGAKVLSHPLHQKFCDITLIEVSKILGLPAVGFKEDGYLDNTRLNCGEVELELIHSPGHSLDSICFYNKKQKFLICGDVIFNKNAGRVDLPGGNGEQLKHSIEELSRLEIEYLLPGHMDIVTGAEKIKSNFEFIKENILRWL